MTRKALEHVWVPNRTVSEIHSLWLAFYQAYDRAVELTRLLPDVTLQVPAQDWATRFKEMQRMLQSVLAAWVATLIIKHPECVTTMTTCWTAIIAQATRQAAGRKSGTGGRLLQLATEPMTAGDLDAVDELPALYEGRSPRGGILNPSSGSEGISEAKELQGPNEQVWYLW